MLRVLRFLVACATVSAAALRAQDDAASRRSAIEMMYPVMIQALEAKAFGRARNICEQAILWEPQNPIHHYNMACIEAQAGRPTQAMGELELAVALGFNDPQHLQNDPDLVPLHREPRFPELLRKITRNAIALDPLAAIALPGGAAPKRAAVSGPLVQPTPAGIRDGRPVGLFWMMRARPAERSWWYFTADGSVYVNPEFGFSPTDLAAHAGRRGTATSAKGRMEVKWTDAPARSGRLQHKDGSATFTWDGATFVAAQPLAKAGDIVGTFAKGQPVASKGSTELAGTSCTFRPDGTFTWSGVAFDSSGTSARVRAASGAAATGTWQLLGYFAVLTDEAGVTVRLGTMRLPTGGVAFGGLAYEKK